MIPEPQVEKYSRAQMTGISLGWRKQKMLQGMCGLGTAGVLSGILLYEVVADISLDREPFMASDYQERGGRWERGSGWGTRVNPWLIHVNVWQKPLQYCKVISLQLIKINGKKKKSAGREQSETEGIGMEEDPCGDKRRMSEATLIKTTKKIFYGEEWGRKLPIVVFRA